MEGFQGFQVKELKDEPLLFMFSSVEAAVWFLEEELEGFVTSMAFMIVIPA